VVESFNNGSNNAGFPIMQLVYTVVFLIMFNACECDQLATHPSGMHFNSLSRHIWDHQFVCIVRHGCA
jgi:hypothetical protein